MKPQIRCATTREGQIEAVFHSLGRANRMVVDRRTGEVLEANVIEGTDAFRWLVNAAREHVAP